MPESIVVTVPKLTQGYVLNEKFKHPGPIYWRLPQVPARPVDRVYFVWDGAVRAWRKVLGFEGEYEGAIVMLDSEHHTIEPLPMKSFQGYHWFEPARGEAAG